MKVYVVTLSQGSYSDQTWELMPTGYVSKQTAEMFVNNMKLLHASRHAAWQAMNDEMAKAVVKFDIDNVPPVRPASFNISAPKKFDPARATYDKSKARHENAMTAYYSVLAERTKKWEPIAKEIESRHTDAWLKSIDKHLVEFADKYCPDMLTGVRYSYQEDDYSVSEIEVEE